MSAPDVPDVPDVVFDGPPLPGTPWSGRHVRTGRGVVVTVGEHVDEHARTLLGAEHPGVLPVLDHHAGTTLVAPRLAGSLHALLAQERALSPRAVAQLVLELTDALDHLHRRGLVHGDLSPGNVLLHADGQPVLADPAARPTAATAGYVAPEVADGGRPSPASDLHALGVLGLECLGRQPAPALRTALAAAADPDPERRPRSAEVLARAVVAAEPGTTWLDRARPGAPFLARPVPQPATRSFGPRRTSASAPPHPPTSTHRRVLVRGALALAGVALAAGASVFATTYGTARGCTEPPDVPVPPEGAVVGDLDGDGCEESIAWDPAAAVAVLPGDRRLQVGVPEDVLLLGDWDCDGRDTPALYRPGTGEVFEFAAWLDGAADLESATTHATGVRDGTPKVVQPTGAGCDRVAVDAPPSP